MNFYYLIIFGGIYMRKALLAAGLAALMAMPVMAEDVATLAEKIDRVDEVLYG